jgi:hypothetical protein
MHRYWAATFPSDYGSFEFSREWVRTFRKEILFAMQAFDAMFSRLVGFLDRNPQFVLWITSSMGQGPTIARPLETQLYIGDLVRFLKHFGLEESDWERRPSMMPRFNFFVAERKVRKFRKKIKQLEIDGSLVTVREAANNFFSVHLGHENLHGGRQEVTLDGRPVSFTDMGLVNQKIEDKSNTTAYHIPQGSLLIYTPDRNKKVAFGRPKVSTLNIAPTVLKHYSVPIPSYMKEPIPLSH